MSAEPIDVTSRIVPPPPVDGFDGGFRMRAAPRADEDDEWVDVETGWSAGHWGPVWGRERRTRWGGWRWTREDAPVERAEDEVEPWLRSACRAIGCVLLGAPIGAWRAASWVIDVPGIRSEHRLHREVHRATDRCEQGIGTVEALHVAIRHHDGYQRMHLRRAWWRRAKAVALVVGGAFGWWWLARHVGAPARCALLGALVLGAVCGAHRIGATWLARRAGGNEWDGIAPRMPAPLNMPDAPPERPRVHREPTGVELLMAVRGVFHPGEQKLPTAEIVARLRNGGGWWSGIEKIWLGQRLSPMVGGSIQVNWRDPETGVRANRNGFALSAITSALAGAAEAPPQ